jgi:tetratricopeptide (TPR) repeat protein
MEGSAAMIRRIVLINMILFISLSEALIAKEVKDYISEAEELAGAGKVTEAAGVMREAVKLYPESSNAYAYLGLYTGMGAGKASNYMEAGRLVTESFNLLDRAVSLDQGNPRAYLFRGIMGVQVPKFLGHLEGGIRDLKILIGMEGKSEIEVPDEMLLAAYRNLEEGYEKKGDVVGQKNILKKIIALSPSAEEVSMAKEKLKEVLNQPHEKESLFSTGKRESEDIEVWKEKYRDNPEDPSPLLKLGQIYYHEGKYEKALEVLEKYVEADSSNAEAYRLLSFSVSGMAQYGYDEKIAQDTNYRSNLAFKAMNFMDRAVELDPHDTELRLIRGIYGITFPFFLGKHQQGVEDLQYVLESNAADSIKAEAMFYMGMARKREATEYWLKVTENYPQSDAADMVYREMRPSLKRFNPDEHDKPLVVVDFVLGFEDQLPPQTAVWIEDSEGNYVSTVYVSGFSGYARDAQVNLPVWSAMSEYRGIDAVTGASIDVGHHIYTWNLEDRGGSRVDHGKYMVRVETSYWPSMKYQLSESSVTVGGGKNVSVVQKGNFIPYLKVSYIPE